MNFHALAPTKYKRSVVSSFVHRIFRSCSSKSLFDESLGKAKEILIANQYPKSFFEPIITATLFKIMDVGDTCDSDLDSSNSSVVEPSFNSNAWIHDIADKDKFLFCMQYRGKETDHFASELHKLNAPCRVVMTLRKLKTVLPSRKPSVEKMMRSDVVYKITCPRCSSCYVGQTIRQLRRRFVEHIGDKGVTRPHMNSCNVTLTEKDISILGSTSKSEGHLLTLEALFINEIKPSLNTKDEFKSRTLTIKF